MTETIEAELVPTPEPKLPPCECWVSAVWRDGCWAFSSWAEEQDCDTELGDYPHSPTRKFHCTDQPRPAATPKRIEAAIIAYERRRDAPIPECEKFFLREFARELLRETK